MNKNFEVVVKTQMIKMRYIEMTDKPFWYQLDKHLPEAEFENDEKIISIGYIAKEYISTECIPMEMMQCECGPGRTMLLKEHDIFQKCEEHQ